MASQHDQLMKRLISHFPDQFLRLAAPHIAGSVDLETIAFAPEEHYPGSPTGRERRADLVARAASLPVDESEDVEDVLLHTEIELQYRSRTKPRLLAYHRGLSLHYALVVHTIVLYLRGGPPGPKLETYEERSLGKTVVAFHYHSFGLSRASAAEYLAKPEPLGWALAVLMRPSRGQPRARLGLACVRRIAAAPGLSTQELDLLFSCVWAYGRFNDEEAEEFDMIMAEIEDREVQDMKMSMMEWWKKQAEASLLKRLLQRRFEELPSWIDERLEQASRQELQGWADRVLDAEQLEDVFSSA